MISIIVAMTKDKVIGRNGTLPWKISADLIHFKKTTLNKPVIMGRKTFDSLQHKPLPNRKNIVISSTLPPKNTTNLVIVSNKEEALEQAHNFPEIMIIGGSKIYEMFLPVADKMYISFIKENYPGDTFFPNYDRDEWRMNSSTKHDEFIIEELEKIHA